MWQPTNSPRWLLGTKYGQAAVSFNRLIDPGTVITRFVVWYGYFVLSLLSWYLKCSGLEYEEASTLPTTIVAMKID